MILSMKFEFIDSFILTPLALLCYCNNIFCEITTRFNFTQRALLSTVNSDDKSLSAWKFMTQDCTWEVCFQVIFHPFSGFPPYRKMYSIAWWFEKGHKLKGEGGTQSCKVVDGKNETNTHYALEKLLHIELHLLWA